MIDEEHDMVKGMNKLVLYSKIATIRDRQKHETNFLIEEYKQQNQKMDLMMELERLKELKFQEDREKVRKDQQRSGALVIVDQIKERELDRLRLKEIQERERQLMLRQIKELEEEDKRILEMKRIQADKMAKEVDEANVRAGDIKEMRKVEERELDLKILQYNIEKARKEEDELAEKK
jgi:hypothetical protein